MDLPRPSQMDPWAIDFMASLLAILVAALFAIIGWGVRRSLDNLGTTIREMSGRIESFTELFRTKIEHHETRITRLETICSSRNPQEGGRRWYDHPDPAGSE